MSVYCRHNCTHTRVACKSLHKFVCGIMCARNVQEYNYVPLDILSLYASSSANKNCSLKQQGLKTKARQAVQ